jgi:hypothetical protein
MATATKEVSRRKPKSASRKSVKRYPMKEPDGHCNGRKTGDKGYCKAVAGRDTWHPGVGRCSRHGGASPTYTPEVYRLRAKQEVKRYSLPVKVDPHTALLSELERTVGVVQFLDFKVNTLEHEGDEANMVGPVGGAQGGFPEFKPNVYWVMWQSERKHLEDVAKSCIAAGIEERRVQLAERQGELIAQAITGVLDELLPDWRDNEQAPKVVRKHLTLLKGGQQEVAAA